MKKIMQLSFAVLCAAFVFTSCGNTLDADVAKTKSYICKSLELGEKAQAGDAEALAEIEKMSKEMDVYMEELKTRYPEGSEDGKAFEAEMKKIMEDPKAACK